MTLVDQRILIPAPMQAVWQVIADHRLLPKWRIDVASVSILTSEPSRMGTRRRIARKGGGPDLIEEMVVWYDGIGYEYKLIEGSDYRSYHARLRLQSAADGTIVQWVISYEFGGILRRIVGGRRRKRRLATLTTDSLRQLRRYVESTGARLDDQYRVKNSMQAAPDAQARAQYGAKLIAQESSRQMAAIQEETPLTAGPRIIEPPVRLEDTPSVPQVMPPSFLREALQTAEFKLPSGVKPVLVDDHQDTRPGPVVESSADISPTNDTQPKPKLLQQEPSLTADSTQPRPATEAVPIVPRASLEMKPIVVDPELADDAEDATNPAKEHLPLSTAKRDTGEVSIWDVFGLRRPSDELSQIITELKQGDTPSDDTSAEAVKSSPIEEPTNTTPVPLDSENVANESPLDLPAMPEDAVVPSVVEVPHDAMVLQSPIAQPPTSPEADPERTGSAEPPTDADSQPTRSLDEWLAADEPPLPESSTGTMKTIVRIEQKPKIGLRRLQRQREEAIRRRNSQDRPLKPDVK